MGLDMYAYTTSKTPSEPFGFQKDTTAEELHYWRKHPDLHGWMKNLYKSRGGFKEFNTITLALTASDFDKLEEDIRNETLPVTSGFFFAASDGTEKADDLEFIAKARAAIAEGKTVFYWPWW